jgi:hypothetical protein
MPRRYYFLSWRKRKTVEKAPRELVIARPISLRHQFAPLSSPATPELGEGGFEERVRVRSRLALPAEANPSPSSSPFEKGERREKKTSRILSELTRESIRS